MKKKLSRDSSQGKRLSQFLALGRLVLQSIARSVDKGARCVRKLNARVMDDLPSDSWVLPVTLSTVFHLLLVVGLFLIIPSSSPDRQVNPTPSFVTARVVTLESQVKAKPKPEPVPKRTVRRPPPKKEVKKTPVKKAAPKPKVDKKAIALKRKKEAEHKAAEQRRVEERKRQQELEKQRENERLQKLQEQEMLAALEQERELQRQQKQLQEQQAAQARADSQTIASYEQLIASLVSAQWTRPATARKGMKTTLRIRLTPTGEVISIATLSSSGDAAFDRSAIQAIQRAAPIRELQGMESRLFESTFRELNFVFDPKDLFD